MALQKSAAVKSVTHGPTTHALTADIIGRHYWSSMITADMTADNVGC